MNSHEGIWHYTFKDKKMNWSQGMYSLFDSQKMTPLNLSEIHQMIHPLDRFKWEMAVNQASLGGPPSLFDTMIVLENGLNVWVRHSISVFVKDGEPVGLEGMCSDITELKIRELERKIERHLTK